MAYFNTTKETGKLLLHHRQKTEAQEDYILRYIRFKTEENKGFKTSSSVLLKLKAFENTPIVSIRRAVTNLVNEGKLEYTGEKRLGLYGRNESIVKLKSK